MALDRIINRVIDKDGALLDLTNDTVNEDRLLEDITAHNSEGEPITGRYDASDAEAWARGTRYGIPVSNTDETYHNNALFYAEESENYAAISGSCMNIAGNYAETAENQAIRSGSFANVAGLSAESAELSEIRSGSFANIAGLSAESASENALKSEGFAVGKQNGTDVGSTSPYYHNNAEYYKNLAEEAAAQAGALDMTGATATTDGTHGLVPAPGVADKDAFLKGDGTWDNPTAAPMVGATASADGVGGSVPAPLMGYQEKVLSGSGTYIDSVVKDRVLVLSTTSAVSALPYVFSDAAIETDMVCLKAELSNPAAQTGEWTVNTDTAGQATISGTISGSTNITLYLMKSR